MKEEALFQYRGQWFIKKEYRGWFDTNGISVEKNHSGLMLICHSPHQENLLFETFFIPSEVVVARKRFCREELFIHFTEKSDAEEIFRNGILPNKGGFMGPGVYALPEEEFEQDGESMHAVLSAYKKRQIEKYGHYIGSSLIIFKYTGPSFECVSGKGMAGVFGLITSHIAEHRILSVIEEKIEYVYE